MNEMSEARVEQEATYWVLIFLSGGEVEAMTIK